MAHSEYGFMHLNAGMLPGDSNYVGRSRFLDSNFITTTDHYEAAAYGASAGSSIWVGVYEKKNNNLANYSLCPTKTTKYGTALLTGNASNDLMMIDALNVLYALSQNGVPIAVPMMDALLFKPYYSTLFEIYSSAVRKDLFAPSLVSTPMSQYVPGGYFALAYSFMDEHDLTTNWEVAREKIDTSLSSRASAIAIELEKMLLAGVKQGDPRCAYPLARALYDNPNCHLYNKENALWAYYMANFNAYRMTTRDPMSFNRLFFPDETDFYRIRHKTDAFIEQNDFSEQVFADVTMEAIESISEGLEGHEKALKECDARERIYIKDHQNYEFVENIVDPSEGQFLITRWHEFNEVKAQTIDVPANKQEQIKQTTPTPSMAQ